MSPRRVAVDLVGDPESLLRSLRKGAEGAERFKINLHELAVSAAESANAQIAASVKRDARLRLDIEAFKKVAASAKRGSIEQVSAAKLASEAQLKLARSMGVAERESRKLSSSAHGVGHDFERMGKGALVGSGALREFGRSAIYAGGSLLVGAGVVEGLKDVVKTAQTSQVVLGQLQTAVRSAGVSFNTYQNAIDGALKTQEKLGFSETDSARAFATLIRGSKNVTEATKEQALAADISRGKNIALGAAANAVARAEGGQTGALRRLVPSIKAGVTATEAIREATIAFGGAATKYARSSAGEQARLSVAIERTKISIGTGLLPTVDELVTSLADWLDKDQNQEKIQKDVAAAVKVSTEAFHGLKAVFDAIAPVVGKTSETLGGTKRTVEALGIAFGLIKAEKVVRQLGLIGLAAGEAGAAGKVSLLATRLKGLGLIAIPAIVIPIITKYSAQYDKDPRNKEGHGALSDFLNSIPLVGSFNKFAIEAGQGINSRISDILGIGGSPSSAPTTTTPTAPAVAQTFTQGPVGGPPVPGPTGTAGANTTVPPPKVVGTSGLSPTARADLALSAAARTKSTSDDLAALNTQHELLSKAIAVETDRLNKAPTTKLAQKFAATLQSLQDKDTAALNAISGIEEAAAAKAQTARDKIAAAAKHHALVVHQALLARLRVQLGTLRDTVKTSHDSRSADAALVAFLRRESQDKSLTPLERSGFSTKLVAETSREAANETKARTTALATTYNRLKALATTGQESKSANAKLVGFLRDEAHDQTLSAKARDFWRGKLVTEKTRERKATEHDATVAAREYSSGVSLHASKLRTAVASARGGHASMDVVSRTFAQYPSLDKYRKLFAFKRSGPNAEGYGSESYGKGERDSFNSKKMAIELFGNVNKPKDVAGEIVSHFLAKSTYGTGPGLDARISKLYREFVKTVTPGSSTMAFLRRDYARGDKSQTFEKYKEIAGLPALFRGQLFHQLDSGDVTYSQAQKEIFARVSKYLATPSGVSGLKLPALNRDSPLRKAFARLIANDKLESHDLKLSKKEREKYAAAAVSDMQRLAGEITKERSAKAAAIARAAAAAQKAAAAVQAKIDLKEGGLSLARQTADFAVAQAGSNQKLLALATAMQQRADRALIKFYKTRIDATKGAVRLGLQGQLLSTQSDLLGLNQAAATAKSEKLQASQLKALGLTAEGALAVRPESLGSEFKRLKGGIAGTSLDTQANKAVFAKIGMDIKSGWHGVTQTAKTAIRSYLDGVDSTLKEGKGFGPTGRVISAERRAAGLGLHGAALQEAESRFAQAAAHQGRVPSAARPTTTVVNQENHFHNIVNPIEIANALEKLGTHSVPSRRGISAGKGRGL